MDSSLFGSILRTFISTNGVEWTPDTVCVFDGLESVSERCLVWYKDKLLTEKASELNREGTKEHQESRPNPSMEPTHKKENYISSTNPLTAIPEGIHIIESEAIVDRKSVFVGRACRISHPSQVCQFTWQKFSTTEPIRVSGCPDFVTSHVR